MRISIVITNYNMFTTRNEVEIWPKGLRSSVS